MLNTFLNGDKMEKERKVGKLHMYINIEKIAYYKNGFFIFKEIFQKLFHG